MPASVIADLGHNGVVPELSGRFVTLIPLAFHHVEDLLAVATDDRSTFSFTPVPWDRTTMDAYVTKALDRQEAGEHLPFATFSVAEQRIVGTTRFYDLTPWDWEGLVEEPGKFRRTGAPDSVSIGYTWLHPSAQRSPVNTEAKVLMIDHAFDVWDARVVRIFTDARNERSRAAVERLGFQLDGVIRADRPAAYGGVRDTALYSLLPTEWPEHRRRLADRLDRSV